MGIRTKLAAALSLPPAVFGGLETVISGREELHVNRCRKILRYSETQISLLLVGQQLHICGRELTLAHYGGGSVTVRGHLEQITFAGEGGETR